MSAISAIWKNADEPQTSRWHATMLSALEAYGPDRKSSWGDSRIALGVNLFHSLPEDRFDAQPVWSDDRSICLVADVRLDNRADLARELGLNRPEELSDSAFLLAAWLRWGFSCLDHLLGGYAFAVWTPGRQELFAARDHAGERPLFYHRGKDLFALASMPQGLLALPGLCNGFQESSVINWLAALQPDRATSFFAGIERLPPGHFLRVSWDTFECTQYWHPANAKPTRYKRDEEYAEALVEILDRATEARLRSTRPIGSFLSAGLDSASVTASAARLLAAQGKGLTAFTSVPRPDFNGITPPGYFAFEGEAAAEVASLYPNVEHRMVDCRGYDLLGTMKVWTDAWDGPISNLVSALWMTAIFDQAKQRGIRVMLAGDLGNCTISWSHWSILGDLFLRGRWVKLARTIHGLRSRGAISYKTAARYSTQSLMPRSLIRRLISEKTLDSLYTPLINPAWMNRHGLDSKVFEATYFGSSNPMMEHSKFYELCDMGALNAVVPAVNQIELRDPTADKRVFDFCFSIPPEQYLTEGHSRSLARRAMKGRLPDSIRLQYARGLQSADWYLPMSEALPDLRHEVDLMEQSPAARQALDLPRIRSVLDTFPQSGYETPQVMMLWHSALTYAISMGYFLRSHESAFAGTAVPLAAPLV